MFRIIVSLLFPVFAHAQWSIDAQSNLVIADRIDDQVQPKIIATNDGGAYISWYDNATGGYDLYLQRINAAGFELWPHNGILVADRGYSSTQDYGLAIDSSGHALLAFRDDRSGSEKITANKISQAGDLMWGTSGIQVSSGTGFLANPKITGTTDGQVVVAWTADTEVVVQKLDSDGMALWGNGVTQTAAGSALITSDLKASDQGTAIVSMVESANFSSPKHIWAQKLAAVDGAPLWGVNPLRVFDLANGSLQFGNFPKFITDGMGGAVFSWYTASPSLNCRVQRVDSMGVEYFTHNGVEASANLTQFRASPASAFDPATQAIYTFWTELDNSQSQSGIYGQKFNVSGARQWTENGKTIVPISNSIRSFVQTSFINNELMVAWINSFGFNDDIVESTQVDSNGDANWIPEVVEIGSNTSTDSRLDSAISSQSFGMYVWSESSDIKAQNINSDGSLGIDLIFKDGFE